MANGVLLSRSALSRPGKEEDALQPVEEQISSQGKVELREDDQDVDSQDEKEGASKPHDLDEDEKQASSLPFEKSRPLDDELDPEQTSGSRATPSLANAVGVVKRTDDQLDQEFEPKDQQVPYSSKQKSGDSDSQEAEAGSKYTSGFADETGKQSKSSMRSQADSAQETEPEDADSLQHSTSQPNKESASSLVKRSAPLESKMFTKPQRSHDRQEADEENKDETTTGKSSDPAAFGKVNDEKLVDETMHKEDRSKKTAGDSATINSQDTNYAESGKQSKSGMRAHADSAQETERASNEGVSSLAKVSTTTMQVNLANAPLDSETFTKLKRAHDRQVADDDEENKDETTTSKSSDPGRASFAFPKATNDEKLADEMMHKQDSNHSQKAGGDSGTMSSLDTNDAGEAGNQNKTSFRSHADSAQETEVADAENLQHSTSQPSEDGSDPSLAKGSTTDSSVHVNLANAPLDSETFAELKRAHDRQVDDDEEEKRANKLENNQTMSDSEKADNTGFKRASKQVEEDGDEKEGAASGVKQDVEDSRQFSRSSRSDASRETAKGPGEEESPQKFRHQSIRAKGHADEERTGGERLTKKQGDRSDDDAAEAKEESQPGKGNLRSSKFASSDATDEMQQKTESSAKASSRTKGVVDQEDDDAEEAKEESQPGKGNLRSSKFASSHATDEKQQKTESSAKASSRTKGVVDQEDDDAEEAKEESQPGKGNLRSSKLASSDATDEMQQKTESSAKTSSRTKGAVDKEDDDAVEAKEELQAGKGKIRSSKFASSDATDEMQQKTESNAKTSSRTKGAVDKEDDDAEEAKEESQPGKGNVRSSKFASSDATDEMQQKTESSAKTSSRTKGVVDQEDDDAEEAKEESQPGKGNLRSSKLASSDATDEMQQKTESSAKTSSRTKGAVDKEDDDAVEAKEELQAGKGNLRSSKFASSDATDEMRQKTESSAKTSSRTKGAVDQEGDDVEEAKEDLQAGKGNLRSSKLASSDATDEMQQKTESSAETSSRTKGAVDKKDDDAVEAKEELQAGKGKIRSSKFASSDATDEIQQKTESNAKTSSRTKGAVDKEDDDAEEAKEESQPGKGNVRSSKFASSDATDEMQQKTESSAETSSRTKGAVDKEDDDAEEAKEESQPGKGSLRSRKSATFSYDAQDADGSQVGQAESILESRWAEDDSKTPGDLEGGSADTKHAVEHADEREKEERSQAGHANSEASEAEKLSNLQDVDSEEQNAATSESNVRMDGGSQELTQDDRDKIGPKKAPSILTKELREERSAEGTNLQEGQSVVMKVSPVEAETRQDTGQEHESGGATQATWPKMSEESRSSLEAEPRTAESKSTQPSDAPTPGPLEALGSIEALGKSEERVKEGSSNPSLLSELRIDSSSGSIESQLPQESPEKDKDSLASSSLGPFKKNLRKPKSLDELEETNAPESQMSS